MVQSLNYNDGVLLVSLVYSCVDLFCEWDHFSRCRQPIHQWLLASFVSVLIFRVVHLVGGWLAEISGNGTGTASAADFLLDLRHKGTVTRLLAAFTWLVALPFFVLWTLLGTLWLWQVWAETPQCTPTPAHLWFSAFWLALCYAWIVIHVALGAVAGLLERRLRRAEVDLRALEDADTRERWGEVSQLSGYRSLSLRTATAGLTPEEIRALPCGTESAETGSDHARECPICITELEPGDRVRQLPGCGHTFHRSCIDLWLLRSADCPLCKRSVRGDEGTSKS